MSNAVASGALDMGSRGRPDNEPKIPDGWLWWHDPATGKRLMAEYSSSGAIKATMVALAYDPTDEELRSGGDFAAACARGTAKEFRFRPVSMFGSGYYVAGGTFESMLPAEPEAPVVTFSQNSAWIKVYADGRVEISPGVLLDDAAKLFWKAVERNCPLGREIK